MQLEGILKALSSGKAVQFLGFVLCTLLSGVPQTVHHCQGYSGKEEVIMYIFLPNVKESVSAKVKPGPKDQETGVGVRKVFY